MLSSFINYNLAFIEGFALILSPCILPILPIILAGSLTANKTQILGIIAGFTLCFAAFTLFSRVLIEQLHIDLDLVRQVAYIAIILFGIILFSDALSEKFAKFTSAIANFGAKFSAEKSGGFLSGLLLGVFTSLIWVPCGGPILAAAIIQTAIQTTTAQSFFTFFFFALGSVVPMLLIAFAGQVLIKQLNFLKSHLHFLRKFFAVIIILGASSFVLFDLYANYRPMPNAPNVVTQNQNEIHANTLINGLAKPYAAPPLEQNTTWFNSTPLNLTALKNKVVLIDFWTYSCINCIRTLPYLNSWYEKYKQDGLVIIGVHAPEFAFEKNPDNVKAAIKKYGISYPVVLDNQYIIWQHYHNQFWPADYLIDKNGQVVYQHFGEGDYAAAENNIRVLLGLNKILAPQEEIPAFSLQQTPETYLGYSRADHFYGGSLIKNKISYYNFPNDSPQNDWSLQGNWDVQSEKIISAEKNAVIKIHFFAKRVYVVMGSQNNTPIKVNVLLNNKSVKQNFAGKDIQNSTITLKQHTLYHVLSLPNTQGGILELIPAEPGAEFYTFTFG